MDCQAVLHASLWLINLFGRDQMFCLLNHHRSMFACPSSEAQKDIRDDIEP